jgi:hypothetical protein
MFENEVLSKIFGPEKMISKKRLKKTAQGGAS